MRKDIVPFREEAIRGEARRLAFVTPVDILKILAAPGYCSNLELIFAILSVTYSAQVADRGFSHDDLESGRGSAEPLALSLLVFIPASARCL